METDSLLTQSFKYDLNVIINNNGIKWKQLLYYFNALSLVYIYGAESNLMSNIYIPFEKNFHLQDIDLEMVSSLFFLGICIGFVAVSLLDHIIFRKWTLLLSIITILLIKAFTTIFLNYYLFIVMRFFMGILCSFIMSLIMMNLVEILPIQFRGILMNSVWFGYFLGNIIFESVMLILMPDLSPSNLQSLLGYTTIPYIVFLIFTVIIYEDSPKYLIDRKNYEAAFKRIEHLYKHRFNQEEQKILIDSVTYVSDAEMNQEIKKPSFKTLFTNKKYLIITVLLMISSFIVNFGYMGVVIVQPKLQTLLVGISSSMNISVIYNLLISNIIGLIGPILSSILSEIKYFGRLKTNIIGIILQILFLILILAIPNAFTYLVSLLLLANNITYINLYTYINEIYETRLRSYAVGIHYCIGFLGVFISQYLCVYLSNLYIYAVFYFLLSLEAIALICSFFLKEETLNKLIM